MAIFNTAYDITMGHEGGYANDPLDTGGETYAGVSRVNNPGWEGWLIVDAVKATRPGNIDTALKARPALGVAVRSIYQTQYWDINRLSQIDNQQIAEQLFDIGVNMGTGIAAGFLQEALNLANNNQRLYPDMVIDRKVGNLTLNTLNAHPKPVNVLKLLIGLKIERYMDIVRKAPAQEKFMNSWLSRIPLAA